MYCRSLSRNAALHGWPARLLAGILAAFALAAQGNAQHAELAAELNPHQIHTGVGPHFRTHGLVAGDYLFYLAATRENHLELWRLTLAEAAAPAPPDIGELPRREDVHLRVLVHNGKTGEFSPRLDRYDGVIDYGSYEPFADPWEHFPTPPGLSYVNGRWAVACDGKLFFTSHDPEVAVDTTELFLSDGTPEGTRLVKDIRPGERGAGIFDLTAVGDRVFFFADDGLHGKELWVSNGTGAGTRMVKDIHPGSGHARAACGMYPFSHDTQAVAFQGQLVFVAGDETHGFAVWRSDGTEAGTVMLAAPYAGIEPPRRPTALAATSDAVYWVTADECGRLRPDDGVPRELWRLDADGKARVWATPLSFGPHLYRDGIHTGDPTPLGARLFFLADGDASGPRLWQADANGAGPVARMPDRDGASTSPGILGTAGGVLYLAMLKPDDTVSEDGPWLPRYADSVWAFEPDSAAPHKILPPEPEGGERFPIPRHAPPVLFDGEHACFPGYRDGGQPLLHIHRPGTDTARPGPALPFRREKGARHDTLPFAAANACLFLLADDGATGLEVHAVPLKPGCVGRTPDTFPARGLGSQVTFLDIAGENLFLRSIGPLGDRAVWRYPVDASGEALRLFHEPAMAHSHAPEPVYDFTPLGGRVYFVAGGALCLLSDDGAPEDVARILPRGEQGHAGPLRALDDRLLVFSATRDTGVRLWSSTGTPPSAVQTVASIPGAFVDDAAVAGGLLYFEVVSREGPNGSSSLWVASEGGATVREVAGPYAAGALTAMQPAGSMIVFAERRADSWRVWQSDGTPEGTTELGVARDSFGGRSETPLAVHPDGRIAFMDTQRGGTLYLRGGEAGEVRTRSLPLGRMLMGGLAVYEDRFYWMTAGAGFADMELWCSGGTRATTRRVHNLGARLLHELPLYVSTKAGLYVAFAAADVRDDVFRELWVHQTGEADTRLVCRSSPLLGTLWEPGGAEIDVQLAVVNGAVLFTNYDYAHGTELWRVTDSAPAP